MTTGFMPNAIAKPIAPGANDPAIKPVGVVLHTAVSKSSSLFSFFRDKSGGIESHFYVRSDGTVEQYRSIFREADAQLDGNSFTLAGRLVGFVSVETEGLGGDLWTAKQLEAIKRIISWVHSQSAFPWRVCPAWNAPGVGYHTMWGSPSHWTPVAKTCPGPKRVQQFHTVLKPWIASQAAGGTKPAPNTPPAAHQRVLDDWTAHRVIDARHVSAVQATDRQPWKDAAYRLHAAINEAHDQYVKETHR